MTRVETSQFGNNEQIFQGFEPIVKESEVTYGNTTEKYAYNNFGQITSVDVYAGTCNTAIYSQTDHYDANGVYIGSSYGGTKYAYGYDDTGFVTSIGYGETAENASVCNEYNL